MKDALRDLGIIVALLFALTACGGYEESDVKDNLKSYCEGDRLFYFDTTAGTVVAVVDNAPECGSGDDAPTEENFE